MKKFHRITSLAILLLGAIMVLSSCFGSGSTTKIQADEKEASNFNNLSDNGWFELYKTVELNAEQREALKDKKVKDLTGDDKTAFEKFKADHNYFITVETEKTTVDKTEYERKIYVVKERLTDPVPLTDKDGNQLYDAEQNPVMIEEPHAGEALTATYRIIDAETKEEKDVERPVVYLEMLDLGLKFAEDTENAGKYTLVSADLVEDKGFLYYVLMPVGKMLTFFNSIVPSYILTLFIFAIIVKIVLFWFAYKQQQSMIKQAKFKPKERAIRNKYKGRDDRVTQQKMQQEIMEAQKAEGVSAFGGCLPMVIQLPIIFILYQVIIGPLKYVASYSSVLVDQLRRVLCYNSLTGLNITQNTAKMFYSGSAQQITELNLLPVLRDNWSVYAGMPGLADKAAADLPNFYAFGSHIDLSVTPSVTFEWPTVLYLLIPIITFVALFFSMRFNRKLTGVATQPAGEEQQNMGMANKIMDLAMPALSTFFTFMFPALLGIYWIFNNLLGTAQQVLLNKIWPLPKFTEEDFKQAEREYKGKEAKRKPTAATVSDPDRKPAGKSLHHIDDDDDEDYPDLPPINEDREPVVEDKKKGRFGKAALKDEEKPGKEKDQPEDKKNNNEDKPE